MQLPLIGEDILVIDNIEYITDDILSGYAEIIGEDHPIYAVYLLTNNIDILDNILLGNDIYRKYIGDNCIFEGIIFGVDII